MPEPSLGSADVVTTSDFASGANMTLHRKLQYCFDASCTLVRHIYSVLVNRHTLPRLLKEILVNLTFILIWIFTFKNARLINPSIRPDIHVKLLERRDHQLFDLTILGTSLQCIVSFYGALWVFILTGKPRLAALGALPPFLLNALHACTNNLMPALDVFAWLSYGVIHFISPFLCALWLCTYNVRVTLYH